MSDNMDHRDYSELDYAIALAQHTVYKRYLPELETYPVMQPTPVLLDETSENCIRFFQLEELSCKQGEDIFQKLSTVYHASMSLGCNLIVMVDVEKIDAPAKIYIGVRNSGEDTEARTRLGASFRTLKNGIRSNFPGTKFHDIPSKSTLPELLDEIFGEETKYISAVSCVASARDKSKTENKAFIQGLERFIDAMSGNTYTALFLAEPITALEQAAIRNGYESLYSTLASFSKSVWTYSENDSEAVMESLGEGVSKAITDGTSHTQAHTLSAGLNLGVNATLGRGHTNTDTKSSPTKVARAGHAVQGIGQMLMNIKDVSPVIAVVGGVMTAAGGAMQGGSIASSVADTISRSLGINRGLNAGYANTKSDTKLQTETSTNTKTKTTGTTETKGTGKSLQIENINKPINEMLKRIDEQLQRTQEGEDYRAYSCGAYFLSGKQESSLLAANTYRALMIGEGSSVESGAINFWNGIDEPETISAMKQYLRRFVHPVFALQISGAGKDEDSFITYTPGTMVSGLELPLHLGLPTRSVHGLPVLEHAEFGRNVAERASHVQKGSKIGLGKLYHMGKVEKQNEVCLDVQSLAAHTFITGSTGSGKSNTIYTMLEHLQEQQVKFLVIEPSKGEYKSVFGGRENVTVYGTNPRLKDAELLRINPFSFPTGVHVLEHMDRLVEIFNVCWPMYAAMPAVLKDAVERAYMDAGWDLLTSVNKWDDRIFPSFGDVLRQIRKVLEGSDYSSDSKGDYTGALVTRVKSLTNGINGLIFTSDEIDNARLFDQNTIVDLSRVGSTETKSLLMGILILKLQEYRMESPETNAPLRHVTVLEEAHSLLRRTSVEQVGESANLRGKSVEMLTNAIAEMRTYGEGFVIADQSPGLLDLAVIRNTNTKILLRLLDYSDRELVGRAAGLNENQIVELEKLERGVAAVSQSSWLEPVLCQVDRHEAKQENVSKTIDNMVYIRSVGDTQKLLLDSIMKRIADKNANLEQKLRTDIIRSRLDTAVKCDFLNYISADKEKATESLRTLAYDFLEAEKALNVSRKCNDIQEWVHSVVDNLPPSVNKYTQKQIDLLMALLIYEQTVRDASYNDILCSFTELYRAKGGVF